MRDDDASAIAFKAVLAASEFADRVDVGLVAHGPDGAIVGANDAACVLLGLTRDQVLGRTSMDSRWGAVHEDGSPFPGEEHPAMVTLRTGAPCTDVIMGIDATGFERRWIAIRSAAADLPEHGIAVVALFVDVGDRVRTGRALVDARAELERATARHRATVAGIPGPFVLMEPVRDGSGAIVDFVVVDANDHARASTWGRRDELVGARLLDRLPEPVQSDVLERCAKVIETGEPLDLPEYLHEHETLEEPRLYEIHATRVGEILACAWRDVTDDRARSDALARTQEVLRAGLDTMPDPQAYLEPSRDAAGRVVDFVFVDANRAMVEFLDATTEALTGSWLRDALPGVTESGFLGMCAHLHETGDPLAVDGFAVVAGRRFDVRGRRVDGGIVVTWREVTDGVVASTEHGGSDERYRLLAEHTAEAILQVGLDGTIEWASSGSATVLGWQPQELVGLRNVDLVHPDDLAWFRVEVARLASTGGTGRFSVRVRRKDDTYCWVEASSSQVDRPGGPPFRAVRLRDVGRELEALHRLAESERRYRLLAENSSDVIVHLVDRHVVWVSPSVERVFGWAPDAVAEVDVADVVHPDDLERALDSVRRVVAGGRVVERFRVQSADGAFHWIEAHAGPYRDEHGALDGVLVTVRIVDAEMDAFMALDRLAHFDPVTGVINRAEALQRLDERLHDRRRRGALGVLYCDVDRFKEVNDSLGHAAGDLVLRTLAQRLAEAIRTDDFVARLGGDEFVVILNGPITLDDAVGVAEKLRHAALDVIAEGPVAYSPSISIGVTVDRELDDADTLLARADRAMYEAKSAGRNRVVSVA